MRASDPDPGDPDPSDPNPGVEPQVLASLGRQALREEPRQPGGDNIISLSSETGAGPAPRGCGTSRGGRPGPSPVPGRTFSLGRPRGAQVYSRPAHAREAAIWVERRAWPRGTGLERWPRGGCPSDNKLRSLSATSRATPSAGHKSIPAVQCGRRNPVHKQISLSNGLQAGRPPAPGWPAAAGQTSVGNAPLPGGRSDTLTLGGMALF